MGAADPAGMDSAVKASPLYPKYAESVDRESAREKLAAKLEHGATQAQAEQGHQGKVPAPAPAPRGRAPKPQKSMVEQVVTSTAFKQVARTAAREIVRGLFGTGRRR